MWTTTGQVGKHGTSCAAPHAAQGGVGWRSLRPGQPGLVQIEQGLSGLSLRSTP